MASESPTKERCAMRQRSKSFALKVLKCISYNRLHCLWWDKAGKSWVMVNLKANYCTWSPNVKCHSWERESERERDRDRVQTKYFISEFEHLLGFLCQSRCLFQKEFFYSIYLFNFLLLQRPNPRQDQSPNLRKKLRYVIGCILLSILCTSVTVKLRKPWTHEKFLEC